MPTFDLFSVVYWINYHAVACNMSVAGQANLSEAYNALQ